MITFLKKNWVTALIVLATLVLAGIAIFTAIRLYQLRQRPVAPNVPESKPKAAGGVPSAECTLTFSLAAEGSPSPTPSGSPSPTPSGSPSPTPSGSPTPTPSGTPAPTPISCNETCTSNADCANSLVCSNGVCRNSSCLAATNCICATPTPRPTATPLAGGTPAPAPELPVAGTGLPTIIGTAAGIILLIGALVLAL